MTASSLIQPESEPGIASAEAGFVVLEGPGGIAATMTVQAAELTALSLHRAAMAAADGLRRESDKVK
ncbi:hypothetical protein BH11PSE5_BH11PSE5_05100 [soil metagenome]|uniref:hypothetical protein n=1 Tax=unclassified Sphingobium TaxID=2611147 RepID=UPI001E34CF55|nr:MULTISPECIES: hypothetical protein [unclassified Sphingobium]GLI99924.1 hypothetical protein Sbs19_37420 [Sphingobium sp. BS19]CAH0355575.1 hypothetical protein SPH9361_03631 [Sphingobium sp. CECT 9361]